MSIMAVFRLRKVFVLLTTLTLTVLALLTFSTMPGNHLPQHVRGLSGQRLDKIGFFEALRPFPWTSFSLAIRSKNDSDIHTYVEQLINLLFPYLIEEPKVTPNSSCRPPPLPKNCTQSSSSSQPRKIGYLMQLGFDADVLEIHLHELHDVVDKIFIIESTYTHSSGFTRKPLVWERVKGQSRFAPFLDKVIHFVVDDASMAQLHSRDKGMMASFDAENQQEELRWAKFLTWNNATKYFQSGDLLGFGDTDEIAARETVYSLRVCDLESDPIDVGIWFPFGSIDQAFMSDHPVSQHPFTLGDPTFWTLAKAHDAKRFKKEKNNAANLRYPTRRRGISDAHVLGGTHMTNYPYLPYQLVKRLSLSEVSYEYLGQVADFQRLASNLSIPQIEEFYKETFYKDHGFRILPLDRVRERDPEMDKISILPWFYACNRGRYPAWEKGLDSRLL